jgi:hypothetical protein
MGGDVSGCSASLTASTLPSLEGASGDVIASSPSTRSSTEASTGAGASPDDASGAPTAKSGLEQPRMARAGASVKRSPHAVTLVTCIIRPDSPCPSEICHGDGWARTRDDHADDRTRYHARPSRTSAYS